MAAQSISSPLAEHRRAAEYRPPRLDWSLASAATMAGGVGGAGEAFGKRLADAGDGSSSSAVSATSASPTVFPEKSA